MRAVPAKAAEVEAAVSQAAEAAVSQAAEASASLSEREHQPKNCRRRMRKVRWSHLRKAQRKWRRDS
jgi:hypothetical protein